MSEQINIRLPEQFLIKAKQYVKLHGFDNVQELIKETLREKLFEESDMTKEELELVTKLVKISEEKNLYGTEAELMRKLNV